MVQTVAKMIAMIIESPLIKIRRAVPEDITDLEAIYRDSWRHAYTGIIPALHLDRMIRGRDARWWRTAMARSKDMLVVEAAGVVAGYATFGPSRGAAAYQGEIYELYLTPVYQGIGLGERLFEACRTALDNRQMRGLIVWALDDNDAATGFYWRRGGRPAGSVKEPFGRTKLSKIAFAWT